MVEKQVFLMKPKHQNHLSQWVGMVYGAQSWTKKRLLCESMFVPIEKWTLILKNGGKRSFSSETNELMSFIPTSREFMVHNHEKNGDYFVNACFSWLTNEL